MLKSDETHLTKKKNLCKFFGKTLGIECFYKQNIFFMLLVDKFHAKW